MKDLTIRVSDEDYALLMQATKENCVFSLKVGEQHVHATLSTLPKVQPPSRDILREDGALFVG